jgi:hypothetical protein
MFKLRDIVAGGKSVTGCFNLSEGMDCTFATAAQRGEAFLRTIKKWDDTK